MVQASASNVKLLFLADSWLNSELSLVFELVVTRYTSHLVEADLTLLHPIIINPGLQLITQEHQHSTLH